MASKKLEDAWDTAGRISGRMYGHRNAARGLEKKLSSEPGWNDLTPEAKTCRIAEGRASIMAAARVDIEPARHIGSDLQQDAERLASARYFRDAKFNDLDPSIEELTRIRLALELPKIPDRTLAAMAQDAVGRAATHLRRF